MGTSKQFIQHRNMLTLLFAPLHCLKRYVLSPFSNAKDKEQNRISEKRYGSFAAWKCTHLLTSIITSKRMFEEGLRSPLKQIYALTKFQTYYFNFSHLFVVFRLVFLTTVAVTFLACWTYTWKTVHQVEHFVLAFNGLIAWHVLNS